VIANGTSSIRNEIVTIDDTGFSSFIRNGWKLVNGTLSRGVADIWLGTNNNSDINSSQYVDGVLNSQVAQSLKSFLNLEATKIEAMRQEMKVKCAGVKNECNIVAGPCLFDINNDPCEENNLATIEPYMMKIMTEKFEIRLNSSVKSRVVPAGKSLNF
jgi:hypothetical protein